MKRNKDSVIGHHPFCQDIYLNKKNPNYDKGRWTCICFLLKAYDNWLKESK